MKKLYFSICFISFSVVAFSQWTKQISGTTNVLYSIVFTGSDTAFAGGEGSTLLKTTNKGANWAKLSVGGTFKTIQFVDINTGYAAGGNYPYGGSI